MTSPSHQQDGGVHRRRPSLLVSTSSMDIPSSSSSSLHSSSSGSLAHLHQPQGTALMSTSPQAFTGSPSSGAAAGGLVGRRQRASSTNVGTHPDDTSTTPTNSSGRRRKGSRSSTGHSEHTPVSQQPASYLPPAAESLVDIASPSDASSSSTLGPPGTSQVGPPSLQPPLNPYVSTPSAASSLSSSHASSSPVGSPLTYGTYGHGPTLRNSSGGRKTSLGRPVSSSSTTAIYNPSSPTRAVRNDDLIPLSPGSGYLPSHAGKATAPNGYSDSSSGPSLPPYTLNAPSSSSSTINLPPLLPSISLSSSGTHTGMHTAYQTAQNSPSLAVSLTMESDSSYPTHSRFFDSNPSSPRPSTSTASESELAHGHGLSAYQTFRPPTSLEKLLPSREDVQEKASEWKRWWKRRNSRSHSGSRGSSIGFVGGSGSLAGERKKRRKRAGTGVVALGGGGSSSWLKRLMPVRKRGWLFATLLLALAVWSLVNWLFWIFNPDKVRLEWRPQCLSPHPSYHSLSPLSGDTLQRIPLPSIGSPDPLFPHPRLPSPLLSPSSLESDDLPPAGVFVGIFSTDSSFERRMLIRSTWANGDVWRGKQGSGLESTRVRFILGKRKSKWKEQIRVEMETFGDIVLLEIPENMNSGKTHDYFSWASDNAMVPIGAGQVGERRPDYVVKSDDDSFIILGELEKRLRVLRGRPVYWGYLIKNLFMGGECYALSLDLVDYVATSAPVRALISGAEDKLVARWMRMHPEKEKILWVSESCWIYDHPRAGTVYSHGFLYPSTVREIQEELLTLDGSGPTEGGSNGRLLSDGKSSGVKVKGKKQADSLSYTSVSQFRTAYRPPLPNMTPLQRVEALIEGSEMSLLSPYSSVTDTSPLLPETVMARRPSLNDRYLGAWNAGRWGSGTVVVHYVKQREWFLETALAFERLAGGMGDEKYESREGRKVEKVTQSGGDVGLKKGLDETSVSERAFEDEADGDEIEAEEVSVDVEEGATDPSN